MARNTPKHAAPRHYRGRKPAEKPQRTSETILEELAAMQTDAEEETESAPEVPEVPEAPEMPEMPEAPQDRVAVYEEMPRRKRRSPVVPIVILLLLAAAGIIVYILWSLGLFGGTSTYSIPGVSPTATPAPTAEPTATPEPTPEPTPTPEPEPTPPPIYDDGTEGYLSSDVLIYDDKAFELFYGTDDIAQAYAEMINACADQLSGVQVYNMVVPNHSAFGVPERVHAYYGTSDQRQNTSTIYEKLSDAVTSVDVYDVLNMHNNENIFFNTDTHWTGLGAYYAYTAFCEAAGCTPAALETFDKTSYDFTGYLAQITDESCLYDNPDTLDLYDPTFNYDCEMSYDGLSYFAMDEINAHFGDSGYSMYLYGDMGCVRVTNHDVQTGRRLLIVKDSYGNAIAPFLMASFDEVHAVDLRYFYDNVPDYCAAHGITDVLILNSEMSANTESRIDSIRNLFNG